MKFIPNAVTRTAARQILVARKHSPHILFVAGVAGVVTSTVLACRATLKLNDTLDHIEHEVKEAKKEYYNPQVLSHREYTKNHNRKDIAYIYTSGAFDVVKLYAPAVIIGTISVGCLTGSHVTLSRRNAGLTAAYATISKAYDEYRKRVREELGEQRELELYRGDVMLKMKNEEGKDELVAVVDPTKGSPYAKFFDEYNKNWKKNAEANQCLITHVQNYANHILNQRGHVFLNEVYHDLGFDHTTEGAVVGWLKDGNGDGYIDFGMYDAQNVNFMNGFERSIRLDFNVDGVIFDKI